jgi:cytoskeleton protein RodZ
VTEQAVYSAVSNPGKVLMTARLAAGLSQEEIASRTRIPLTSIQAVEDEDWIQLPAPVYVRGFLRLYANELGANADEIVGGWRAAAGDASGRVRPTSARTLGNDTGRPARWLGALAGVAAMAVVVGIVFALLTDEQPPSVEADAGGGAVQQFAPASDD